MKAINIVGVFFVSLLLIVMSTPAIGASTRNIDVALLSYSPNPVQPGQVMDLYLQVTKRSDPVTDEDMARPSYTDQPWIEIVEDYPFHLEWSQDLERVDSLGNVAFAQELQFRIRVDDNAKDGTYPLSVRFGSGDNRGQFYETVFDINVETFDAYISVESVEQQPAQIVPGSEGKIIVNIRNNDDKPLRNIDVVMDFTNSMDAFSNMDNLIAMQAMVNSRLEQINRRVASGLSPLGGATPMMSGQSEGDTSEKKSFSAFSPVGTSTQKRIGVLQPGEVENVVFDIIARPDIKADVYSVPLFINYNDDDNNPFHVQSHFGVVVNDEPEIFVELESSTLRTVDFFGDVVVTIANRGLSDVKFAQITLLDSDDYELITAPKSFYMGSLTPGESKQATFRVVPNKEDVTFAFQVEYRDAFNKHEVMNRKVPFSVLNKNFYMDPRPELLYVWIIIGIVMAVLLGLYLRLFFNKKFDSDTK